jgi:hypothetical protein
MGKSRYSHRLATPQITTAPESQKGLSREGKPLNSGAAGRIRTHDPLVRSQVLYPTELQPLKERNYTTIIFFCANANRVLIAFFCVVAFWLFLRQTAGSANVV